MFIEPVFGKKFFGREEVLATLHKRVTAMKGGYRQNLALAGPMLSGKSSILRHFLNNLKDPDIIPLYIEMTEEGYEEFCTRFMATLLYRYLKSVGMKNEGDFDSLVEASRESVPKTVHRVEEINRALKKKKNDDAYQKLLELPAVFKEETGKSCIVILDEFHNLSNFKIKKPFQVFGKYIMVQKNTMYIVSSSQKTLLKDILSKKLSLLFGNFEIIEIEGFDNQTANSFVADKAKDCGIEEDVKAFLIQLTQGNPLYLEIFVKRISELVKASDRKRSARECLVDAFADVLYDSNGLLNQFFTNSVNFFLERKARKKFLPILTALALGANTLKTIKGSLGRSDKDLAQKLEKLRYMDLIYKSGVFYKITDKLFEYWLKNVYCVKTKSMIDDMDIKYLEFKNAAERELQDFRLFNSTDLVDIVVCLFKNFNSEKVLIGMHEKVMPKFDTVTSRRVSENIFEVTGRKGNNHWVCRLKLNDMADEGDLSDLASLKPRNKQSKISRKILIPINGVEHHAFLLSKEKNIWVWNTPRLNDILRLYGRFELAL